MSSFWATLYGLSGVVHMWISSYLTNRTQYVNSVLESRSTRLPVWCGVPKRSVLGPMFFLLYTANLVQLVESFGLYPYMLTTLRSMSFVMSTGREAGVMEFGLKGPDVTGLSRTTRESRYSGLWNLGLYPHSAHPLKLQISANSKTYRGKGWTGTCPAPMPTCNGV